MNVNAVVISAFTLCLIGCGGSSSDSDLDKIPTANSSLNTQTPEGIWLVSSNQLGKYTLPEVKTDIDTVKEVRQFVAIQKLADGRYSMPDCGFNLFKQLKAIPLTIKNGKVSESGTIDLARNDAESYTLDLAFENNLTFTGTIDVTKKNTSDVYLYNDKNKATISAVKVSDSTNFESANELSIAFSAQLNDDVSLTFSDLAHSVTCIAVSSASYTGMQLGQASVFSEESIFVADVEGAGVTFNRSTGTLGSEAIDNKSYSSLLTSLKGHGAVSCAAKDETCVLTKTLSLSHNSIVERSSNEGISLIGITASAAAVNDNDESLKVSYSLKIQ